MRDGKPIDPDEVERMRGMSMVHLALELKIKPWRLPFMLARGRTMMRRRIGTVDVFPGIVDVIRTLHADGHKLYVVSSNSVQNIRPVLKRNDVRDEFIKLYGGAGIFGKAHILRKVLKKQKLDPTQTIYIGDEARDVEGAQRAGIRIISVTWGYNTEKLLRSHDPDFIAVSPDAICSIVAESL